jgi:Putative nuclear envelope organisation protein
MVALVRKNMRKAKFQGKDAYLVASASASSAASVAYDSASSLLTKATDSASSAGAKYGSQATDYAYKKKDELFEAAVDSWSESRLKSYLDERGVPVPQNGKIDELRAAVRHNAHKARVRAGFSDAAFDTWSTEQLHEFLGKKAKGTRDELIASAKKNYASASSKGGDVWSSLTAQGAKATSYAFDAWSDSDLKSFLDSYGVPVPQGSKRNELIAAARRNSRYYTQGPDWYNTGFIAQIQSYAEQGIEYIKNFIAGASGSAYKAGERAGDAAKEQATIAKDRAYEKGQQAYDKVKEEL